MHSFTVNPVDARERADVYVSKRFPEFPRSVLVKLFETEDITINNEPAKPGYRLHEGDRIKADLSKLDYDPEPIELPIIYEDEDVLVIDKPAGVISHARGRFHNEGSVASFVRQRATDLRGERAGIVHRLDRATSGVMVTAKNEETLSFLQKQFNDRKVDKEYVALVSGTLPHEQAVIDMPIGRNPSNPKQFTVTNEGRPAQTKYEVVQSAGDVTMVKLRPQTGRTHQLRVHLKQIGRPIIGDELYGGKAAPRLFLHAHKLSLTLPDGKRTEFVSPLPASFEEQLR